MAYYMCQVERGRTPEDREWRAICEEHGTVAQGGTQDDMIDAGADHDAEHGYEGGDGWDE